MIVGAPESVSINGRSYSCPADADLKHILGGVSNTVLMNGDGQSHRTAQERKAWKVTTPINLDPDNDDQETLQDVIDAGLDVDVSINMPNAVVYSGKGIITGDVERSSKAGTCDITMEGSGKLNKQ